MPIDIPIKAGNSRKVHQVYTIAEVEQLLSKRIRLTERGRITGGGAGGPGDPVGSDLQDLQNQIDQLNNVDLPNLQSQLDANDIDIANLQVDLANLNEVEVVSSLSPSGDYIGQVVYLTTDEKLHRWNGTVWITEVAAIDITGTITETQIANDSISTPKLQANSVTAAEIAALTITANEIATDAITSNKILTGAITTAKIAAGAITTAKLGAGAVTAVKIAAGTITSNEIAAGTITASELATGSVTTNKIAAGAVTALKIAVGTITANEIAAGTITASEIAASTITANKLNISTLSSVAVNTGTLTVSGTLTMGVNGKITNKNTDFTIDKTGFEITTVSNWNPNKAYTIRDSIGRVDVGGVYGNKSAVFLHSKRPRSAVIGPYKVNILGLIRFPSKLITLNSNGLMFMGGRDIYRSFIQIAAQSGITDDFNGIRIDDSGSPENGTTILLIAASGDVITIKDGVDNIITNSGNVTLNDRRIIPFTYDSRNGGRYIMWGGLAV